MTVDPANVENPIEDACNKVLTYAIFVVIVEPTMLENSIDGSCIRVLTFAQSVVMVHPANVETPIEDAITVLVDIVEFNIDELMNTPTFIDDAVTEER